MFSFFSSKIQSLLVTIFQSPKSEILPDLPQEIISEILLLLPAKSICRFRCISKPWLSLLTSYDFIKAHLAHHSHSLSQQQKLLLLSPQHSLFNLLGDNNHLRKLEFFDEPVYTMVGSCNGLILVEAYYNVPVLVGAEKEPFSIVWLIDCFIQEYVKLPPLHRPYYVYRTIGFGYDCNGEDYKIVTISSPRENDKDNTIVDIYSSNMRSWRTFRTLPYDIDLIHGDPGVFLNGALHWNRFDSPSIVAFDLSSDKFNEISAPAAAINGFEFTSCILMVIDGCLGIAVERPLEVYFNEVWFMKSYPVVGSWTKLVINVEFIDKCWPCCFYEDRMLFELGDGIMKWYYLQDGRVELCFTEDDNMHYKFINGITYSESLVSPHFIA